MTAASTSAERILLCVVIADVWTFHQPPVSLPSSGLPQMRERTQVSSSKIYGMGIAYITTHQHDP